MQSIKTAHVPCLQRSSTMNWFAEFSIHNARKSLNDVCTKAFLVLQNFRSQVELLPIMKVCPTHAILPKGNFFKNGIYEEKATKVTYARSVGFATRSRKCPVARRVHTDIIRVPEKFQDQMPNPCGVSAATCTARAAISPPDQLGLRPDFCVVSAASWNAQNKR